MSIMVDLPDGPALMGLQVDPPLELDEVDIDVTTFRAPAMFDADTLRIPDSDMRALAELAEIAANARRDP